MPYYSNKSRRGLNSCHPDIITIFDSVIKYFDNTILYGYRSPREQFLLYQKGRKYNVITRKWEIINRKEVVTFRDGYIKRSMHNRQPSLAVDSTPYPIDFEDEERQLYFIGFVLGMARQMYESGVIQHMIRNGRDWDSDKDLDDQTFNDFCHFEIIG
jgi:peptidoglycan LD-endopeptidase CwlK